MANHGILAGLVIYPDENHSVTLPEQAIHRLEALDDWVDEFNIDHPRDT